MPVCKLRGECAVSLARVGMHMGRVAEKKNARGCRLERVGVVALSSLMKIGNGHKFSRMKSLLDDSG